MGEGFTLVIPTFRAADELRLCLRSLRTNSRLDHEYAVIVDVDRPGEPDQAVLRVLEEFGVRPAVADTNMGPYAGWNRGARAASREWVCFVDDDQYFAPDWDVCLARHFERGRMLASTLVESGAHLVGPDNLEADFGLTVDEFDEAGFNGFASRVALDEIVPGGHFIPLVIHREDFERVGPFNEDPFYRPEPDAPRVSSDVEFVNRALRRGLTIRRSRASFSYHFMGASHRGRGELRRLLRFVKPSWSNEERLAKLRRYMAGGEMPPEVTLYAGLQALQHGNLSDAERVFLGLMGSPLDPEIPYLALALVALERGDRRGAFSFTVFARQLAPASPRADALLKHLTSPRPAEPAVATQPDIGPDCVPPGGGLYSSGKAET